MTILKAKDMDRLQKLLTPMEKEKFMKRYKYRMMLLTIFESNITVNQVTPKDRILLNQCIIDFDNRIQSSLNPEQKFKIRILVPLTQKPITKGGKYIEHVFGLKNEILRQEWVFILQVIRQSDS